MKRKKRRPAANPIFESIRKPVAPAAKKFGPERSEAKLDPVRRKAKHKKRIKEELSNSDAQ